MDIIPINLKLLSDLEDGSGRGFLEGTQTKGGFVPEQHTDYIFTVGEEWGFVGSSNHHYLSPYFLESST
jgi:hypothetical protein